MLKENVTNFTEKETEFIDLFIDLGTKQNVAKVLVFLAKTQKATSRAIEHGAGLRQPEVSVAMHYLMEKNCIRMYDSEAESKGRPLKIYELVKPLSEIIDSIDEEKRKETTRQLQLIQKLRHHVQ